MPLEIKSFVLNTAHFSCITFCMEVLTSPVELSPLLKRILSKRSNTGSNEPLSISIFLLLVFIFSFAVMLDAFPKTTKSIRELVPNLFAP